MNNNDYLTGFFNDMIKAKAVVFEELRHKMQLSHEEAMKDVRAAMDFNMFKYNWCMTMKMTPAEYTYPYFKKMTQEETDKYFIEYFSDEEMLRQEFDSLKSILGSGWGETLNEALIYVLEDRFRIVIPLLVTGIEKGIKNLIAKEDEHSKLYGRPLANKITEHLLGVKEKNKNHLYVVKFAEVVDVLYKQRFLKGSVSSYVEVEGLNRNLIGHGNHDPDLWERKHVYQLDRKSVV